MRKTTEHIRACRICAVELDSLKEQIATMVEAEEMLWESLPAPARPWPRLEPRLEAAAVKSLPFWKNPLPSLESAFRMPLTYGSAALSLLLIALLIWWPVATVSAKEVIERSTAADRERLKITPREVVRQRVQVTKTRALAFREETALLESWKSTRSTYWQSGDPINVELLNRYKANGLASALPLSPLALEAWLKLAGSGPNASRHGESIEVQAASDAHGRAQGLQEVSFSVLARNWHVYAMTLSFQDTIFEIREEQSSILDRREVPKDVLAQLEPQPGSLNAPVRATPTLAASRNATPAVNLDNLEVAVRYDLHSLGADLGENIEITKSPSNRLVVNAAGASPAIKEHLAAMLGNKPGVDLEFVTPAGQTGARRGAATTVMPQTAVPHQDERLLNFFGGLDAQENNARAVLQTNTKILAHLYALQDLARRWPPNNENSLSAASTAELSTIVRDHARAVKAEVSQFETELDPLLKNFGQPIKSEAAPLSRTAWQGVSLSALDAARSADRILRSLLTISDSPVSLDDGLPKLKQSVEDLDRAARELSSATQ